MVEDDDLRLVVDPVEPGGARRIGEDEGRARAYMRRAQLMDSLKSAAAVV